MWHCFFFLLYVAFEIFLAVFTLKRAPLLPVIFMIGRGSSIAKKHISFSSSVLGCNVLPWFYWPFTFFFLLFLTLIALITIPFLLVSLELRCYMISLFNVSFFVLAIVALTKYLTFSCRPYASVLFASLNC